MSNIAHKARDVKHYPLTTDPEQSKEPIPIHPSRRQRLEWAVNVSLTHGMNPIISRLLIQVAYDAGINGCFRAVKGMAARLCMGKTTTGNGLRQLTAEGFLIRQGRISKGGTVRYFVNCPPSWKAPTQVREMDKGVREMDRGVQQMATPSQQMATEPKKEPGEETLEGNSAREAVSQNETKDAGDGADKPRGKGLCPTCGGLRWVDDLELGFGLNKCPSCTGGAEPATRKGTPTNGAGKPQREPDLGKEDCKACRGSGGVTIAVDSSAANVACPKCRPAAYRGWKENRRNKPGIDPSLPTVTARNKHTGVVETATEGSSVFLIGTGWVPRR